MYPLHALHMRCASAGSGMGVATAHLGVWSGLQGFGRETSGFCEQCSGTLGLNWVTVAAPCDVLGASHASLFPAHLGVLKALKWWVEALPFHAD